MRFCIQSVLLIALGLRAAAAADDLPASGSDPSTDRTVMRRLNRVEYQNTMRDLLAIEADLLQLLPLDTSASGFDNVGNAMHTSSFLMDRYLESADKALSIAIASGPRPPTSVKQYSLKDERIVRTTTESVYLHREDSLVMFSSSAWNSITVTQFYPQIRGTYRVKMSASGYQSHGKPVTIRIDAGPMLMGTKNHLVGYFDFPADQPTVLEFTQHFEARDHFRLSPYGLATAHTLNQVGAEKYDGPGIAVQWVEVEGPLHDTWPPESHRRIFGDLEQQASPVRNQSNRLEVVSESPREDADRIIQRFARRAFRRPVSADELRPILQLVHAGLEAQRSFEQSVRVGLAAVLVSPEFLFLRESPGRLNDFELASRLSYFLWSTMPDDELMTLAEQGAFTGSNSREVFRNQVERMLHDSKSQQFVKNFCGQWLGLRDIDFTEPSHLLYPEFDDLLKVSMVQETELFFAEVLQQDLSLANFVASDFTMLNGRLAKHYGIPFDAAVPAADGTIGYAAFRRVPLPADSHRGGLLTMGSILKVTANGTLTSPVTRGVWVLDRILGETPAPPPDNVTALEPDIRGATTIREQLAKHRQIESCASCHDEIDPYGFALESFDVIGGWRENYRTTGNGESVVVDGRRMPYHKGKPVDPAGVLSDGREFQQIDELKQLLLAEEEKLALALTSKLLICATGAEPRLADDPEVAAIVTRLREKNYGLRSLIHEIVLSDLFCHK